MRREPRHLCRAPDPRREPRSIRSTELRGHVTRAVIEQLSSRPFTERELNQSAGVARFARKQAPGSCEHGRCLIVCHGRRFVILPDRVFELSDARGEGSLAVDQPRYAETIDHRAKARSPERLLQWHQDRPVRDERVVDPLGFSRVANLQ